MQYKILIIGKRKSGKTSLRTIFCFDYFIETYTASESLSMSSRSVSDNSFTFIESSELNPVFNDSSFDCVILLFDSNDADGLNQISLFHENLRQFTTSFFLVGNKCDLESEILHEDVQNLAHLLQCRFLFCSCKTGEGLEELWQSILSKLNVASS